MSRIIAFGKHRHCWTAHQLSGSYVVPTHVPPGFQELRALEIDARTAELQGIPEMPTDRLSEIHEGLRNLGEEAIFWKSLANKED